MPRTREDLDLIDHIKTALKDVYDPSTLEQLCSKQLCRRLDKVKQCLIQMVQEGTVEHYGEEYMLAENVSDIIRDEWLTDVHNREANLMTKRKLSSSSYAEAVKRRVSAPGMMDGACGDSQEMKEYKRSASASAILPGVSNIETQAIAVREEHPVQHIHHHHEHTTVHNHHNTVVNHHNTVVNNPVFECPQYHQNVFNAGDNANIQIGNQNEIDCQESPKRQTPKRGKRRK